MRTSENVLKHIYVYILMINWILIFKLKVLWLEEKQDIFHQ